MKYYCLSFCVDDMQFSNKEIENEPPISALRKIKTMGLTKNYQSCFYVLLSEIDEQNKWERKIIERIIELAEEAIKEQEREILKANENMVKLQAELNTGEQS